MRPRRAVGRRAALVVALALLAALGLAETAPDSSVAAQAEEQLARLAAREGKAAPREVLLRNLARYFARYNLPSQPEELGRLLGTLERMMDRAAVELWEAAAASAATGSTTVTRSELAAALERYLPATPNPWGEAVFFARAPVGQRVAVETIDLTAFRDTGLVWQRLGELASAPPAEAPTRPPLAADAVPLLAEGMSAYGLLTLRLGGEAARAEYASTVASHHLRDAGKQLTERAAAHATGAGANEIAPLNAPPGSLFRDVTEESGIRFRHTTAHWLSFFRRYGPVTPTFSGGGVTAGDADGDGRDDLVFCGGRGCALYRNRGDGTFEDVTAAAGIGVPGEARMALLADFDNDSRRDLFVTYSSEGNRLFRGLGGGRFADVTEASGLHRPGDMSGPAAAVDVDGDALLDLYVGNFGDFLHGENPWHPTESRNAQPNRLYRNLGGLRFADGTEAAGVGDTGWAQALSHVDYDADGDQDLLVANDFGRDDLFENRGDGTFRSVGAETGSDDPFHGMNVAWTDLNRDRLPDAFVTNIWFWDPIRDAVTETNSLLLSARRSDGRAVFSRSADPALLSRDTGWAWGALFFDVEHDGDDDLIVANGFTDYLTFTQNRRAPDDPERLYPINNGREPNVFFRNDGGIPNVVVEDSGAELPEHNSRGVALLDADRDGDLDLAISTFHAEGHLFENVAAPAGSRWLVIDLVGDPARGVPRDAFGATVVAEAPGLYVWRALSGGEGYLSQSSHLLHFGLGNASAVDLEIVWPGGERQTLSGVAANQRLRVRQGQATPEPLGP